jgi:uncharacterized membrane protein
MADSKLGKGVSSATRAAGSVLQELPTDRLTSEVSNLAGALGQRAISSLTERLEATADRLTEYAQNGEGRPGLLAALTGAERLARGQSPMRAGLAAGVSGLKGMAKGLVDKIKGSAGGGGGGGTLKVTNIIESVDVGVPVQVAYDQWTRFEDFPQFMKKVEKVEQESDEKLQWRAQIFWSHRDWEATIIEQVPDERIVWRSNGPKGHVDGAVTFHELAPNLTRIVLVLEYFPQGLFERTGNLWRAQGRRARLELKHFARQVMTETILHPDELEGWRGEIHDSEVSPPEGLEEQEPEEEEPARPGERSRSRGRRPSGARDREEEVIDDEEGYEPEGRARPRGNGRQASGRQPGRRGETPRRVSRPSTRASRGE